MWYTYEGAGLRREGGLGCVGRGEGGARKRVMVWRAGVTDHRILSSIGKAYQVVDQSFGGAQQHREEGCTAAWAFAAWLLHPAPTVHSTCM